jgi:hypothetical protein
MIRRTSTCFGAGSPAPSAGSFPLRTWAASTASTTRNSPSVAPATVQPRGRLVIAAAVAVIATVIVAAAAAAVAAVVVSHVVA